jgi:hypothetical protein
LSTTEAQKRSLKYGSNRLEENIRIAVLSRTVSRPDAIRPAGLSDYQPGLHRQIGNPNCLDRPGGFQCGLGYDWGGQGWSQPDSPGFFYGILMAIVTIALEGYYQGTDPSFAFTMGFVFFYFFMRRRQGKHLNA